MTIIALETTERYASDGIIDKCRPSRVMLLHSMAS